MAISYRKSLPALDALRPDDGAPPYPMQSRPLRVALMASSVGNAQAFLFASSLKEAWAASNVL